MARVAVDVGKRRDQLVAGVDCRRAAGEAKVVVQAVAGDHALIAQDLVGTGGVEEQRVAVLTVRILPAGSLPGGQGCFLHAVPHAHLGARDRRVEEVEVGNESGRAAAHLHGSAGIDLDYVVVEQNSARARGNLHSIAARLIDRIVAHVLAVVAAGDRNRNVGVGVDHIIVDLGIARVADADRIAVDMIAGNGRVVRRDAGVRVGIHVVARGDCAVVRVHADGVLVHQVAGGLCGVVHGDAHGTPVRLTVDLVVGDLHPVGGTNSALSVVVDLIVQNPDRIGLIVAIDLDTPVGVAVDQAGLDGIAGIFEEQTRIAVVEHRASLQGEVRAAPRKAGVELDSIAGVAVDFAAADSDALGNGCGGGIR